VVTLRPAALEELDILLGFEQGIVEAERPFDTAIKPGEVHYYDLEQLILSPDAEVIVAVKTREVVGSGYVLKTASKSHYAHDYHAYIGFLFVKPEHRKQGINKLILSGLLAWARQQGLDVVELEVYPDNLPAVKAYEKAGFKSHLLRMRLDQS